MVEISHRTIGGPGIILEIDESFMVSRKDIKERSRI